VEEKYLSSSGQLNNPHNISKILTLLPGVETTFKIRFTPKCAKVYSLKLPLNLHKATRQVEVIPQRL
jgi:hypothetical protein